MRPLAFVDPELFSPPFRLSLAFAVFSLRFRVALCDPQVLRSLLPPLALLRLEALLERRRFFLERCLLPLMLLRELALERLRLLFLSLAVLVDDRLLERRRFLE